MKAQMYHFDKWIEKTNPKELKETFEGMLKDSGFGICGCIEKHFKPYGFTCLYLLSESHFAIHTFPEEGKTYIELSSCIKAPFLKFKELLNQRKTI